MHRPQQPTLSQLGRDTSSGGLSSGTKLTSGSCIRQTETVLGNQPQPQCVFAQESNACLVLTWPYASHMAKEGLGCLWLHVRCCLVGVFHSVKPTANVFSFEEKADLAGKGFVCPGPSKPSLASSGWTP